MQLNKGKYYSTLTSARKDDETLKNCIEETVTKLLESQTSLKKPGVLLGKIQSGKTRAFIGVIALAFDNGYDVAIVLTKGTKALAEQTLQRLKENPDGLGSFEDNNELQIHDIMSFPSNLPGFVLNQKLILVSKKEDDNLRHLLTAIIQTYPQLQDKKVLIIDDEADFASLSFYKDRESGGIEQGKIASQIDEIRTKVKESDFLQVTATPYSLFLQPNDDDGSDGLFPPKRPAFTVILPTYRNYVGGDYYFIESEEENSAASHVYIPIPVEELDILNVSKKLKRADRRSFKLEEVFTSPHTQTIRKAIINFIVGGCIRRIQQSREGKTLEYYSLVIHTDIHRISHFWQEDLVKKLNEELLHIAKNDIDLFRRFIAEAHQNLKPSLEIGGFVIPDLEEVVKNVAQVLGEGMLFVQTVNSEKDIKALLDNKGQLRLWAPLNIFIGGQILDRGITIKNMIGFYYGRNPKTFQQDTVLQHSRMYGARSKEDLAVTRFYTTLGIYDIMRRIHEFDEALRQEIDRMIKTGSFEKMVYFIRKDEHGRLAPCSPNKLLLSNIVTLKKNKRLLPIAFQTNFKTKIKDTVEELDKEIFSLGNNKEAHLVPLEQALSLIDKIEKTLVYEEEEKAQGYSWDTKAHKASLEHLSKNSANLQERNKVWIVIDESNISRTKQDGRPSDSPDGGSAEHVARRTAKEVAIDTPALILIRVTGPQWRSTPFWWPIIMTPENTHTTIFASETIRSKKITSLNLEETDVVSSSS